MSQDTPRADVLAEGRVLVQQLVEAEQAIAHVRERVDLFMRRLSAVDEDLAALDAMRRVFQRSKR